MKIKQGSFVEILRGKIRRTTRMVNENEFDVLPGTEFETPVDVVRHDIVLFRGKEAGKLQYRKGKFTGKTILDVHDSESVKLGDHIWAMLLETCEDVSDFVVVRGRVVNPRRRNRNGGNQMAGSRRY
jgi:hypothetical protein